MFWASPNARHGFQWGQARRLIAVALWLATSGLFGLHVANFSHHNTIYGRLAGVIIFLIWMWISRDDRPPGSMTLTTRITRLYHRPGR